MRLSFYYAQGVRHIAREFSKPFYNSKEWEQVRRFVLMRDKYLCQVCGAPAEEVHHKKHLSPENIWDTSVSLNPENLISLCKDCHFAQHKKDKANGHRKNKDISEGDCPKGFHFDANGQLIPN